MSDLVAARPDLAVERTVPLQGGQGVAVGGRKGNLQSFMATYFEKTSDEPESWQQYGMKNITFITRGENKGATPREGPFIEEMYGAWAERSAEKSYTTAKEIATDLNSLGYYAPSDRLPPAKKRLGLTKGVYSAVFVRLKTSPTPQPALALVPQPVGGVAASVTEPITATAPTDPEGRATGGHGAVTPAETPALPAVGGSDDRASKRQRVGDADT